MHVSQTAQYALRAVLHLAADPPADRARCRDIAEATGIPAPYLSKILRRLVERGLVRAARGHHGGFVLAKAPERIRLSDVFEAAGGGLERDLCIFGVGRCDTVHPCPLHDSWSRLNDAFHAWSRSTTLGAVAGAGAAVARRLAGAGGPAAARRRPAGPGGRRGRSVS